MYFKEIATWRDTEILTGAMTQNFQRVSATTKLN